MDVKEKLVELLRNSPHLDIVKGYKGNDCTFEQGADWLIANGVTVQDGNPLDAFLHPVDAYKGLKAKYLVFKADTGEIVENCFVLRPDKDHASVEALRAYASATDNETLSKDIYNWVGKGVTVQEWIPASEPPKDTCEYWIAYKAGGDYSYSTGYFDGKYWCSALTHHKIPVTNWMPIPQPPKGE